MKHPERFAHVLATVLVLASTLALSQEKSESQAAPPHAQTQQQSPPKRIRVSGATLQKMIVSRTNPTFTEEQQKEQREKRIQGPVSLRVIVATTGGVSEVTLIEGNPFLAGPAIDAVKQWKFQAPTLKGAPVEVEGTIMLNFTLSGG